MTEDVLDALAATDYDLRTSTTVEPGRGDRLALFTLRPITALDRGSERLVRRAARPSPLLEKLLGDGIHLRAMLGSLGFLPSVIGVALGLTALVQTGSSPEHPPIPLFIALVVLGIIDAFGGALGVLVFALGSLAGLGVGADGIDVTDLRLLAGVVVAGFGPIVIARSTREFRRDPSRPTTLAERVGDVAFAALLGGWVASLVFRALPALTGLALPAGDHVATVRVVATVAVAVRIGLEIAAAKWFPFRVELLSPDDLPEPPAWQPRVAKLARLGAFLFVASSFMGTGAALWLAAGLYLLPTAIEAVGERIPTVTTVHHWLPTGLPALAMVLGLEIVLEGALEGLLGEHPDFAIVFVCALFAMLAIVALLGALGREGVDGGWRRMIAGPGGRWLVPAGSVATFAMVTRFTFIL
jgi:hypothetical protein